MKMEQKKCSETSAYKFQTPGNHPKESIQQIFPSLSYTFHETFMSAVSDDVKQLSNCSFKVGASLVRKHWTGKRMDFFLYKQKLRD